MRDFDIQGLKQQLASADISQYPMANQIEQGALLYDADTLAGDPETAKAELYSALLDGPGIFVVRNLIQDHEIIDRASEIFDQIIESE